MPTPTKTKARLTAITPFADDVFTLDFAVDPRYARFKPGQFLHLALDDFDPTQAYWPESRVFSICSAPRTDIISVIYSVKGTFTTRMRDQLTVGEEYWLKLPYGDFIIEQLVPQGSTAVLVSGGTGISPFVSYLQHSINAGFNRSVYLAYAVRTSDRLVFEPLLCTLATLDSVDVRVWSEENAPSHALVTHAGLLDLDRIVHEVSDRPDPHYLLSGPPQMLNTFSAQLQEHYGVAARNVHIDEWE